MFIIRFLLSLLNPLNIFILMAILAVVIFFILRRRNKKKLAEMDKEDEWMQSLDDNEWQ